MRNDTISDTLIRLKNAYLARKIEALIPYTKMSSELINLLIKNGFATAVRTKDNEGHKSLIVNLKYNDKSPAISDIRRISKPSLRVYIDRYGIAKLLRGLGIVVISTSAGLMTGHEALKKKIGGEVVCKIT